VGGGGRVLKSFLLIGASGVAVGGGLYAGGAFDRGQVYHLSVDEARARLTTLKIPPVVRATAGASDAADVDIEVGSESVAWEISVGTGEPARFTAALEAEGPARTRVTLDYTNGRIDGGHADRLLSTSFMRGFSETMFEEEVDARLEGRAADHGEALHSFARRAAADPSQVRELGAATEGIFRDVAKQMEELKRAEPRQPTVRESMAAATRPTLVLPKQK
jgi:hypothetical protein